MTRQRPIESSGLIHLGEHPVGRAERDQDPDHERIRKSDCSLRVPCYRSAPLVAQGGDGQALRGRDQRPFGEKLDKVELQPHKVLIVRSW
jgi:predicted membrane-bound spermidine synthase